MSSTYSSFYTNLKSAQGEKVRKLLETFVKDHIRSRQLYNKTREHQSEIIQDLMIKMAKLYELIFPSKNDSLVDAVENCVCKNLHVELFTHLAEPDELIQNQSIADTILKYKKFIQPKHLELSTKRINEERLQQLISLLDQIDNMKTPKGKLNIIINFAKVISLMLQETSASGEPDGADLFFPTQIYALFQLNEFSKLKSNLVYIRCFRVELKGEEEYYITALESALEFILNLKLSDLKLDQNEDKVFKSLSEGGLNQLYEIDLIGDLIGFQNMSPNNFDSQIAMTDTDETQHRQLQTQEFGNFQNSMLATSPDQQKLILPELASITFVEAVKLHNKHQQTESKQFANQLQQTDSKLTNEQHQQTIIVSLIDKDQQTDLDGTTIDYQKHQSEVATEQLQHFSNQIRSLLGDRTSFEECTVQELRHMFEINMQLLKNNNQTK